jgi:2,4-dienoyl-CoA reductase-like NADH-dependent reductase (Old Yellow Enzyme family)
VAAYYRRRAEGGAGLIVTEGTYIPHPSSRFYPSVPLFYGQPSLTGWRRVVDEVHQAGGRIFPQLWHVGITPVSGGKYSPHALGPSGIGNPGEQAGQAMTIRQIEEVVLAFGQAARSARELAFDGVELHGAHGYLIDQFFWDRTNLRTDGYGGPHPLCRRVDRRGTFPGRPRIPICFRYSQWKQMDYAARLARTPQELERFLEPLAAAGVDLFHCSQRRFWEPEFEPSPLNLAGWTKKLTGKPTIRVGSVTLNQEFLHTFKSSDLAATTGIDELVERLRQDEFDLVAVGRSLIVNPAWPRIVARCAVANLLPFQRTALAELE